MTEIAVVKGPLRVQRRRYMEELWVGTTGGVVAMEC